MAERFQRSGRARIAFARLRSGPFHLREMVERSTRRHAPTLPRGFPRGPAGAGKQRSRRDDFPPSKQLGPPSSGQSRCVPSCYGLVGGPVCRVTRACTGRAAYSTNNTGASDAMDWEVSASWRHDFLILSGADLVGLPVPLATRQQRKGFRAHS
jgi:hypothetical protein